jgi:hypothetical protein
MLCTSGIAGEPNGQERPGTKQSGKQFSFVDVPLWVYLVAMLFALVIFVLYFRVDWLKIQRSKLLTTP